MEKLNFQDVLHDNQIAVHNAQISTLAYYYERVHSRVEELYEELDRLSEVESEILELSEEELLVSSDLDELRGRVPNINSIACATISADKIAVGSISGKRLSW